MIKRQTIKPVLILSIFGGLCLTADSQALASSWQIDSQQSKATFSVKHMMISTVKGSFSKLEGTVDYDGKNLKEAKVQASIDVDSIDTNSKQRDDHLRSKDFFNSKKYPKIKFTSKKITEREQGFDIEGDLTIHGVTKPVTLNAGKLVTLGNDSQTPNKIAATATSQINRKDFGMTFNKQLDNGGAMVGDEVAIVLEIEMTSQDKSGK
ncbi:MAG: YceI family protein [Candidatus Obscuribacter phosphatis]|uniref:YceI family protein n=1 Tax=Candidatus Obscuribacter phosphatis TaxID=1906157 RepID=A0A8J7PD28_9BACT|nr:YceI family protein [Candidatus Obscuribacter phosphatis]